MGGGEIGYIDGCRIRLTTVDVPVSALFYCALIIRFVKVKVLVDQVF